MAAKLSLPQTLAFETLPALLLGAGGLQAGLAAGLGDLAAAGIALALFAASHAILSRIGAQPAAAGPRFDPCDLAVGLEADVPEPLPTLILTDRIDDDDPTPAEDDDAVPAPPPPLRLVESGAPTAGELSERIEAHLAAPPRTAPDASAELHEALAALRQSLR